MAGVKQQFPSWWNCNGIDERTFPLFFRPKKKDIDYPKELYELAICFWKNCGLRLAIGIVCAVPYPGSSISRQFHIPAVSRHKRKALCP